MSQLETIDYLPLSGVQSVLLAISHVAEASDKKGKDEGILKTKLTPLSSNNLITNPM